MSRDKILFGAKKYPFYELSPWYYCTFSIGGKKYRTLIHYWLSCCFVDDRSEFIRNTDTPENAVKKAYFWGVRSLKGIDKKIILKSIYERFNQNEGLINILISTGNCELIYCNEDLGLFFNNQYGKILEGLREVFIGADK
jgi:predicted NAD-dependent protein-ADP-ribosyltransferase YbiA (DUF1768 family)